MTVTLSISDICQTRLEQWAKEMADHHATPLLVLGVGHDHAAGELHLFTVHDISDDDLMLFLAFAFQEVKQRRVAA